MAGLSLFLVVGGALVVASLTDEERYVAPTPHSSRERPSPALAAQALARLQAAVADGDARAAAALAPAGDDRAADLLEAVVHNAEALDLRGFTLRYIDVEGAITPGGGWSAAVDARWRLSGFDRAPASAEIVVRLRSEGGRVAVTGLGGGDRVSPLWLSGPLQVRRTASTLVMVDGAAAEADSYAARAVAAVPVVRRVVPAWRRGLVVEVPASVDELDRVLAAEPGTYDQIAAVTTSADGSQAADAPVHVFVNPDVFDRLRPTGAQVVMSHEATHVATGAWASTMPLWLLEGFADFVALRDVDLPLSRSAAQVVAEVRRAGAPRALPAADEFGTRAPDLGASYESAWLACRLLAEDGGQAALVRFYRSVDAGSSVGAALRSSFGLTLPGFTRQWRGLLTHLAE